MEAWEASSRGGSALSFPGPGQLQSGPGPLILCDNMPDSFAHSLVGELCEGSLKIRYVAEG